MQRYSPRVVLLFALSITLFSSCGTTSKWKGQAPIKKVSTVTKPVQYQYQGIFDLGDGVFVSNDFDGARLNGIVRVNDTLISALITPENAPINMSPWYAFKVWSADKKKISLRLTYSKDAFHRYYPKVSKDRKTWSRLDADQYKETTFGMYGQRKLPKEVELTMDVGSDTLWVAAQEIISSNDTYTWIDRVEELPYASASTIGKSREGRPIELLKIGSTNDQRMIFVMSRQHPPEVTGYLAMEAFVEAIASDDPVAKEFRSKFTTYVVPMVNPDGVDHGHWRHCIGGIDLNRDWADANQPEVRIVQQFLEEKKKHGKIYFGVDFHSTWKDIFYVIDPQLKGNAPGLVPDMINAMSKELGLEPNVKPNLSKYNKVTSKDYFFYKLNAESLTYEIGDDTSRDLLKRKGKVSAQKLMELLLERVK